VQGFEPLALIVGAAGRLAIDGDEVMTARPQRGDPAFEAACEQGRIDAVHQVAQPARARDAMVELGELPQKIEMMLAPFDDVLEIVARGDRGAGHQQQVVVIGFIFKSGSATRIERRLGALLRVEAKINLLLEHAGID
jgi:hypothetical protein